MAEAGAPRTSWSHCGYLLFPEIGSAIELLYLDTSNSCRHPKW